jgi:hypothetical protein
MVPQLHCRAQAIARRAFASGGGAAFFHQKSRPDAGSAKPEKKNGRKAGRLHITKNLGVALTLASRKSWRRART